MKNVWLNNKITCKGYPFWTFEILDAKQTKIVSETVTLIDESPSIKVVEKLEVEDAGRKVWCPVLVVWEKLEVIYTDIKFLENHSHLRLLEANGDAVGTLRHYDKSGDHVESWVMHGLQLDDVDYPGNWLKATFVFHHAVYLSDK